MKLFSLPVIAAGALLAGCVTSPATNAAADLAANSQRSQLTPSAPGEDLSHICPADPSE